MRELVEYIARNLVDEPEAVVVQEHRSGARLVYHLQVADGDMGKVIGKQGRIANAMRALLKVAAARSGERATLEIG